MLILEYPPCSTCKKAKAWLDSHGISYTTRHIKDENPSYEELRQWYAESGLPLKKFFNTSGLKYKELGLKDKLPAMSEDEQLHLLATDGMLVKRPLVIGEGKILTGFREKEWEQALLFGKTHDTVRVVNDQIGTPTYTYDLARLLVDMNETEKYGYYHATNEGGYISWYDFTREIYRQAGYQTKVLPVTTEEYGLNKAARPFNSRLDRSKLIESGFTPLPTWQDALSRYLKEIGC